MHVKLITSFCTSIDNTYLHVYCTNIRMVFIYSLYARRLNCPLQTMTQNMFIHSSDDFKSKFTQTGTPLFADPQRFNISPCCIHVQDHGGCGYMFTNARKRHTSYHIQLEHQNTAFLAWQSQLIDLQKITPFEGLCDFRVKLVCPDIFKLVTCNLIFFTVQSL